MELQPPSGASGSLRALRSLVKLTFAVFGVLLAVILAHGFDPDPAFVLPAEVLAAALAVLAVGSIGAAVNWGWRAHPRHRRVIVFVVAITAVTLLAHAYVVGTPAVFAPGSVSGTAGTPGVPGSGLADGQVSGQATITGGHLYITLSASGGHAIAQANVTLNGQPVTGGWNAASPSFAQPLEPGNSASGTWTLPGSGAGGGKVGVSYDYLTCYDTKGGNYGCIMDEIYYVPYGMSVLNGTHCFTGVGAPNGCHLEHPPLTPALIAAGMAVFGEYSATGWRAFPAVLGTFSVPLLFGIAWKVSGSKKVASLSATLLALDVMFFSQSGAAVLDVPEVFFVLAAFFVYFAKVRLWKLDRYVLAGVFLGLAGLAKETAVFMALAFATYVLFFEEGRTLDRAYSILKVALVVGLVFAGGVQLYDSTLATSAYPNFLHNVSYILTYGSGLTTGCPWQCGWKDAATGGYITPLSWFTYYAPIEYFAVTVTVNPGNISYPSIAYYGVTNLLVSWTVYVWVPLAAYALYRYRKKPKPSETAEAAPVDPPAAGETTAGEAKFAGLALTMFAWGYVPYLFILFGIDRVTYPFYVIPAIPALAMGASFWLSRSFFPRWLMYVYLALVFGFFFIYFPEKGFLPVWLRSLIGH